MVGRGRRVLQQLADSNIAFEVFSLDLDLTSQKVPCKTKYNLFIQTSSPVGDRLVYFGWKTNCEPCFIPRLVQSELAQFFISAFPSLESNLFSVHQKSAKDRPSSRGEIPVIWRRRLRGWSVTFAATFTTMDDQ